MHYDDDATPWDVLHFAMTYDMLCSIPKKPGAVIERMRPEHRAKLKQLTSDMTQNAWNYITYYGEK